LRTLSSDIEALSLRTIPIEIEAMPVMDTATATSVSNVVEEDLLSGIWTIIVSARSELLLFIVAMAVYFVLFMQRTPKVPNQQEKKKTSKQNFNEEEYPTDAYAKTADLSPQERANVEEALCSAFGNSDYRSVLRCWNTMKKFETAPSVSLAHVVESMQRFNKDTPFILRELKGFLKKFPSEGDASCLKDLLESLAKRLDSDLVEKIVDMLPSVNLKMDANSYEILLGMYFTTRNFQDVKDLVSRMKNEKVPFTTRASMVVIKTALKSNNFEDAVKCFRDLKASWTTSSPSMAPMHVVSQLIELACKEHRLSEFLPELRGMDVSTEVLNNMLAECVRQRDVMLTTSVEKFGNEQGVHFTDVTYGLLIKGLATDPTRVRALFNKALENNVEASQDLVNAVLSVSAQTNNVEMADKLYAHMKPEQLPVLSAFIRFYADGEQFEKACDVYENDILRLHGSTEDRRSPHMDARMERSLMNAALKCNRSHLANTLLSSSPSDIAKHITMIRNCAAEKDLKGAVSVFTSLEQSCVDLNPVIYNTVLDACVECRDLKAAEKWMQKMKEADMNDVVSFNTIIKAHLQHGNFEKARSLIDEMKKEGLQPNRVTFNELMNAMACKGGNAARKYMWDIIDEMAAADVKPNQVTISILLKNLNSYSSEAEIKKTMDLINTMDEPMDEVLLSSVVEACVRIGKPDLLEAKLKQLQGTTAITINGSHTYGSLIKAYGHARDIDGIWRCWKEMRSRHIKPTSVTLGCMVEAISNNGDTEGAFDLIHQIQDDEQCRGALNSVIYCSILKGFTRERKMDRVWAVYQEMVDWNIELSIVTYNTIIDACARCGRMENLPKILENMRTNCVKPNVITYSTMLKGHCQNGNVQEGFAMLEQMKTVAKLKPDEIVYNSLLDGCAQNSLVDEGLRLLDEMQREGVQPSNFTLSILVKLMNRARRLEQAFSIVEEITSKYQFRPNVHVYTNLIQACVSNQQVSRGMGVLEEMIKERVTPESRTYSILVRTSMARGAFEQAVGLLRGALGLPDALPFLQKSHAACWNLESGLINETLSNLAERGHAQDLANPLLTSIRQNAPKVRVDAGTQRRVMDNLGFVKQPLPAQSKGKGKGAWDRDRW
jgi:pentatricopeptide repeat protein